MDSKYSQHSHGQARANQAAQPLLLAAVEDLASAQSSAVGPFCVGDIGCSVGNASVAELAVVVRCLDEQGCDDREVSITHVDQPSNHWDQLFTVLASHPDGYTTVRPKGQGGAIFSYALARDMYQQCFPSASMHLIYSGITPHWGSAAVNAPDHLFAQFSADAKTQQAAQQQGRSDVLRWLQLRARELKAGGHLIFTAIGAQNEASAGALRQAHDIASKSWFQLVSQGHITQEECTRPCFPIHFWMLEACIEVIEQEMGDTFSVLHSSSGSVSQTSDSAGESSNEEASKAAAAGMVVVLGPGLRQALVRRSAHEQDHVLQCFRQELRDQLVAAHIEFFTHYVVLALKRK